MEFVESGVEGLDEICGGGFPKGSTILISGETGTGKTTLSMQFLVHGVANNEKGVYISFEDDPDVILSNFASYSWDLKSLVKDKSLGIIKTELHQFDALKRLIEDQLDKYGAVRLVIDTITMLGMFIKDNYEFRKSIVDLMGFLRKKGVTTLITSDVPVGEEDKLSFFGVEEYPVDGVIRLYYHKSSSEFLRMIGVMKLRGVKHTYKLHPVEFQASGLIVHSNEPVFI